MDKWDLTRIYKSENDFLADISKLEEITEIMGKYQGKLSEYSKLKEYLKYSYEVEKLLSKAYMYASMKASLDSKTVENLKDLQIARTTFNKLINATAFESPECISLGKEYFDKFFEDNKDMSEFKFGYEKLFRGQQHVLDNKSETILSYYNELTNQGSALYDSLSSSDWVDNEVVLSNGEKVVINQSNWRNLIAQLENKEDRKIVFEAIFSNYEKNKSTYADIYKTIYLSELANKNARNYASILESHLFNNNIPEQVFLTLVDVVSSSTAPVKKYYEIRRKHLKLDKHRSYDRFIQLGKADKKYTYEEAKEIFYKSISKFDQDFQLKAHEVTKDGYVDVYPNVGKQSGAYSTGGDNIHPFILLNFDGYIDDVFTLAHESGHSIHTLYSMETQPLMLQNYTIFVAEIASTFNEHNLLDYLFKSGNLSKQERIFLLQKSIDEIISTFYRQTLFGEFEYEASKLFEQGKPTNYQVFSNIMIDLYQKYYGIDIKEEKYKEYVWAYIPHLYHTPFYVYQYATSFTASMQIYENVKSGKKDAFRNYIEMLKSGGSNYPIEQVKKAGVDLTKKEPYQAVLNRLSKLVDQLECELNND